MAAWSEMPIRQMAGLRCICCSKLPIRTTICSLWTKYLQFVDQALLPWERMMIGTVALYGPTSCNGLAVFRYNEGLLSARPGKVANRSNRSRRTTSRRRAAFILAASGLAERGAARLACKLVWHQHHAACVHDARFGPVVKENEVVEPNYSPDVNSLNAREGFYA